MFLWSCALHQPGKSFLFTSSSYLRSRIPPLLLSALSPLCIPCLSAVGFQLWVFSSVTICITFLIALFTTIFQFCLIFLQLQVSNNHFSLASEFRTKASQSSLSIQYLSMQVHNSYIDLDPKLQFCFVFFLNKWPALVEVRLQQALLCV